MSEPIIRTFSVPSLGATTTELAASKAGNIVVNAIHECITRTGDGKGHYWSLDTDSLSGTGIRTETGLVTGMVLKNSYTDFDGTSKTQKLTLRSYSSTRLNIACALHPEGESSTFTLLPTSNGLIKTAASFTGAQTSFSGEEPIAGGYSNVRVWGVSAELSYYNLTSVRIADNQAVTGWVIELPDAITIALKANTTANWQYGVHAGKIINPVDESDYALGFDGSAILVGGPSFYNSTDDGHRWWMRGIGDPNSEANVNIHSSRVRVGLNMAWATPYVVNSGIQAVAPASINGNIRFVPYEIRAGDDGQDTVAKTQGLIGYTRYLRKGTAGALNNVVDSPNSSNNISWLRQYVAGANALMFHIWKRDVSPTTAQ